MDDSSENYYRRRRLPTRYNNDTSQILLLHPHDCIVFEDALSSVQAAKAAGCYVVAVPDPCFTPEKTTIFYKLAAEVLPNLSHFDLQTTIR